MNKEDKLPLEVFLIYNQEELENGKGDIYVADVDSKRDLDYKSNCFYGCDTNKNVVLKLKNEGFIVKLSNDSSGYPLVRKNLEDCVELIIDHPDFDENFNDVKQFLRIAVPLRNYLEIVKTSTSINGEIQEKFSLVLIKGNLQAYELVSENSVEELKKYQERSKLQRVSKKTSKWVFGHKYLLDNNDEYICLGSIFMYSEIARSRYSYFGPSRYISVPNEGALIIKLTDEVNEVLQDTELDFSNIINVLYEKVRYFTDLIFRKKLYSAVDCGEYFTNKQSKTFNEVRDDIINYTISKCIDSDDLDTAYSKLEELFILSDTNTLSFPKNVLEKIFKLYEWKIKKELNCYRSFTWADFYRTISYSYGTTSYQNFFKDVFSINILDKAKEIYDSEKIS